MKDIFVVFALCFVGINAAVVLDARSTNFGDLVSDVIQEAGQIAIQTAETLERQMEIIVMEPLTQVEEAVHAIEERREDNEKCVAAQDELVIEIVDGMHQQMNSCGIVAAQTSAEIVSDVNAATQQLIFDGYDVLNTYNRCRRFTNSILKNSCYARLTVKATLYMRNARRSIQTIQQSTNERLPAVFTDAETCTHSAADSAVLELENVHHNIDACVVQH